MHRGSFNKDSILDNYLDGDMMQMIIQREKKQFETMDTRQAQKPCLRIKIRRNVLLGILATGFCTTFNSNQLGPISKQKLGFSALS